IWVTCIGLNAALEFAPDGGNIVTFGSYGTAPGQFAFPSGVAVGPSGDIFVADTLNNRIQQFHPPNVFVRTLGTAGSGLGQFNFPRGVAVNAAGGIFVAGQFHDRIQVFGPGGQLIREFGTHGTGEGELVQPWGVSVDASDNVWVAEAGNDGFPGNNRVQKFDSAGNFIFKFGDGYMDDPTGIAIGQSRVYVVDNFGL